jgi:aminopeptidase N
MQRFLAIAFLFLGLSCLAQQIDVQYYHFEIELSDKSDAITGKALITVKFLSDASQLQFDLASPDQEKGMIAFQVKEGAEILRATQANDILTIMLGRAARKGEERSFEINYMGIPADGLVISKNKYGDRTFFADNWPNRAHNWIPCIDRPDDKAPFEFLVTAPDHYKVISNGIRIEERKLDNNRKLTYWREETPLPTKVMVIGAAAFAVKEFADSPPELPVSAWVYPQDSTNGFYDYGLTPGIVKFFSAYIAPFPYRKLANVQSKTIFGGMENASAIFYAEASVTGNRKWEEVMAHEIVHQWFGDMASEKSFAHLWLSEGFATYLTDIYFENRYGKDSANKRLEKEREEVAAFVRKNDHPVVDTTTDLMSLLNANSYQKGAWVLHMLRGEAGDSLFRKIIQTYYQQFKGGNADTRDFEAVAEKVSGKDLKWFFDQWLYAPGIPELAIQTKMEKDGVKLKIGQGRHLFRFPLDIAFVMADGTSRTERLWIKDKETECKLKMGKPAKVIIDPEKKLLYVEKKF